MKYPIYLDYAATTPIDPRVAEVIMSGLAIYGNASSTHILGRQAKQAIDTARQQLADLIKAHPEEIIWTSGATESDNLALKGAASLYQRKGKHIVTIQTEHSAVLDCCQQLEKEGYQVTYLTPLSNGLVDLAHLEAALRPDTILVSVMLVNNEIGVIQDIPAIANITSSRGILLHVDAAQALGKLPINLTDTPIDLMSFCAHKCYGPKGIGALYVRRKPRIRVAAQIHGGGHEQGMRSGTLATHQIMGMGAACAIAQSEMQNEMQRIAELKQRFWQGVAGDKITVNGDMAHSIATIINLRFAGCKSDELMLAMPELAVSAGSACHAKGIEPSYVLRALGLTAEQAHASLRFSFGRFTTVEEIDFAVQCIRKLLY